MAVHTKGTCRKFLILNLILKNNIVANRRKNRTKSWASRICVPYVGARLTFDV